jgi:succinate dehydrogenase / fumarate reductase iron-sulfur subunit
MRQQDAKRVQKFRIYRWDPEAERTRATIPSRSTRRLRPMVLDALIKIKNEVDPT